MHSVVIGLPREIERRIAQDSEFHGHRVAARAQNIGEVELAVGSGDADWAVLGAGADWLNSRLLEACDLAGVRIVALAASDSERRHAADLGLREVLDAGASWEQIEAVLTPFGAEVPPIGTEASLSRPLRGEELSPRWQEKVDSSSGGESGQRRGDVLGPRRGEVIAVWGPAGAPGRTTVAIAIAAELAADGFSVALVDADTHSGAIAPALGMLDEAPGFAAACRLASTNSLTSAELERISDRYSSPHGSFWVLTGIGRPHRWPELSGERVTSTLAACRKWVDYTVVDTGFSIENDEEISSDLRAPQRNAATITALREADRVVAVGSGDPVGLSRFLRAHVDLLDLVDAERVLAVINRLRTSAIGANPAGQVEKTLLRFGGIVAAGLIPHDQGSLDAAILTGKTLIDVAAKSAPRVAMRALVAKHLAPAQVVPAPRSLRSRVGALSGRAPAH